MWIHSGSEGDDEAQMWTLMKGLHGFSLHIFNHFALHHFCHMLHALVKIWEKTKQTELQLCCSKVASYHLFCVSLSPIPPPPLQQPQLTIKPTKSTAVCTLSNQAQLSSLQSSLHWLLLTTNRYCELFHIQLGFILPVISVRYVTIRRWLKTAIHPWGVYLMIPTWECFTASLS